MSEWDKLTGAEKEAKDCAIALINLEAAIMLDMELNGEGVYPLA